VLVRQQRKIQLGLTVEKAGGLPEAICEMAKDIRDGGKPTSSAIAIAVSQAKKLCAKGNAKYCTAVAEWERLKAKAHADNVKASAESPLDTVIRLAPEPCCLSDVVELSVLTTKKRNKLSTSAFADPKNRKYPVPDAAHVRAAISYISKPKNAAVYPLNGVTLSSVKARIRAAAKKFGVEISGDF
jgi:hypothetical protein